ncbi:Chromatin structure-remodeling complex subunit snf21; AltName: Full=ATP-dependent helicase snf21; AltName: Full=RSC complex subunit snf21 [Serendipita indica DSM 11827]|nr:Chromatin structure-remodeling complex subunit snf21; AltName: Full=ATP-dependent helicase snf21; AltName: Full=RSC complex subunit snf21 [Serendipita indica DSM 11827]
MATTVRPPMAAGAGGYPMLTQGARNDPALANALQRLAVMQQSGIPTDDSNEEARNLKAFIQSYHARLQAQNATPQHSDAHPLTNGKPQMADSASQPPAGVPGTSPSPPIALSFTDTQFNTLKAQISAWKYVQRAAPVPDAIQQAARLNGEAAAPPGRMVEDPNNIEHDTSSLIFPFNAYVSPFEQSKQIQGQRSLMPTLYPQGLDILPMLAERRRFIDARIEQRLNELGQLSSTIGEGLEGPPVDDKSEALKKLAQRGIFPPTTASGKLRLLIEQKGLALRQKQRANSARFASPLRDARATEAAERRQRLERERRAKQKHLDYLRIICQHGQRILTEKRNNLSKVQRLGRGLAKFHSETEKEEQRRVERIAKERLRALKNDDEDTYLKLIDTAKDTRITQLLAQTDTYLDSLAQAVAEQQRSAGGRPMMAMAEYDQIDGPIDETAFGASKLEDADDKGKVDYYRVAHRINEKITTQPRILTGGTLKEYQLKGLQWMVSLYNNKLDGILADEMGLGKTIQTISLITYLIERKNEPGPYLVIVPLSTLTNWSLEFAKWAPSLTVISYKGLPNVRRNLQMQLRNQFHVLLTTYEYIIKDRPILCKWKWTHMIIDEGHRMKNTNSKLSQTLTQFYTSRHRLILTGTPLQNNLPELWALLNFVLPKVFNSIQSFDEWFNTPFANTGGGDKIELNEEESLLIIRRLHKVLRPFLLRRLKKDVEADLPDKSERVIKVRMSGLQSRLYYQMQNFGMIVSGAGNGKAQQIKGLQNVLMQYRKICQHPYLFDDVETSMANHGLGGMEQLIRVSGKMELCNRMLPKLFRSGHRVLMFFQMTKVMDIMEDYLRYRGWEFLRLDGSTKPEDRAELLAKFNAPNSPYNIFLLSTRAGGLGLNLQTADTVILYDSDWNPHADLQAQDRAHRIGQTKIVRIYRFVTEKSIEESMLARARNKLNIDEKVIQAGKFDNKSSAQEREAILRQLIEGDQDDAEESGILNDDEMNEILARNEEEADLFHQIDKDTARENEQRIANGGYRTDLISVEELPEIYRTEEAPRLLEEVQAVGRGHRKRNNVAYAENLTEADFIKQIDGYYTDEEPPPGTAPPPLALAGGRNAKPVESDSEPEAPKRNRVRNAPPGSAKRKRIGKAETPPELEEDEEVERPAPKRRKTGAPSAPKEPPLPPHVRERMREAFQACHRAVLDLRDDTGRLRCELFKELPDRDDYPDYYMHIQQPIAISTIRKRVSGTYYKSVAQFKADWHLMFNNARTYNTEGSIVYDDANEMQKVFDETLDRVTAGLDIPMTNSVNSTAVSGYATPVSTGNVPPPPGSGSSAAGLQDYSTPPRRTVKRAIVDSDDEDYNSSS